MKSIAVCLKIQKMNSYEYVSMWKNLPISYNDMNALNLACNLAFIFSTKINIYIMSPMSNYRFITELTNYGFNKISFISDNMLAGADTLGTAKVLSRALNNNCEDVIILGGRSDDSATGQVPVQVSAIMNYDFYSFTCLENTFDIVSKKDNRGVVFSVNQTIEEKYPCIRMISDFVTQVEVLDTNQLGDGIFPVKYTEVVSFSNSVIKESENEIINIDEGFDLINEIIDNEGKHNYG